MFTLPRAWCSQRQPAIYPALPTNISSLPTPTGSNTVNSSAARQNSASSACKQRETIKYRVQSNVYLVMYIIVVVIAVVCSKHILQLDLYDEMTCTAKKISSLTIYEWNLKSLFPKTEIKVVSLLLTPQCLWRSKADRSCHAVYKVIKDKKFIFKVRGVSCLGGDSVPQVVMNDCGDSEDPSVS